MPWVTRSGNSLDKSFWICICERQYFSGTLFSMKSDNIHSFSGLGYTKICAVKHFPYDIVPQFIQRTKDGRKRPARRAKLRQLCDNNPGTFSSSRYLGFLTAAILAISKKRVPRVSLNPFRFPAIEKLWQGNPPHIRSRSGSSFGSIFLASS